MPQNNYSPPQGYGPPGGTNGQPTYSPQGPTANRTNYQGEPPRRLLTIPQMLKGGGQPSQTQATPTGYTTQSGGRYR